MLTVSPSGELTHAGFLKDTVMLSLVGYAISLVSVLFELEENHRDNRLLDPWYC